MSLPRQVIALNNQGVASLASGDPTVSVALFQAADQTMVLQLTMLASTTSVTGKAPLARTACPSEDDATISLGRVLPTSAHDRVEGQSSGASTVNCSGRDTPETRTNSSIKRCADAAGDAEEQQSFLQGMNLLDIPFVYDSTSVLANWYVALAILKFNLAVAHHAGSLHHAATAEQRRVLGSHALALYESLQAVLIYIRVSLLERKTQDWGLLAAQGVPPSFASSHCCNGLLDLMVMATYNNLETICYYRSQYHDSERHFRRLIFYAIAVPSAITATTSGAGLIHQLGGGAPSSITDATQPTSQGFPTDQLQQLLTSTTGRRLEELTTAADDLLEWHKSSFLCNALALQAPKNAPAA